MTPATIDVRPSARDCVSDIIESLDVEVRALNWHIVADKLREHRRADLGHEHVLPERAREKRA